MSKITADDVRLACHKVLSDRTLLPRDNVTYCNIGFVRILMELDSQNLHYFIDERNKKPFLANAIVDILDEKFETIDLKTLLDNILSSNVIYVAGIKGVNHGHVALVYPMHGFVYSSKFKTLVPLVANVGKINGIMGLNYAFSEMPKIYVIKEG